MKLISRNKIDNAVDSLLDVLYRRPDKDLRCCWSALETGKHPQCAPVQINRQSSADEQRPVRGKLSLSERLVENLDFLLDQLKIENPTAPCLETGFGVGTVATVLGAVLDLQNNAFPDMPLEHISLERFDNFEPSLFAEAGLMPAVREEIDFYKTYTPTEVLISVPNLQGPFNIAHTLVGSDLFLHMTDQPERVHHLMQMVTDVLIEAWTQIPQWIGEERLSPSPGLSYSIAATRSRCFISECSCNMISPAYYREFVLPYDRRLEQHFGRLAFHPCSGRHVFEVIFESFPETRYTEAGWIEHLGQGTISVEEALERIAGRDITLGVGEELVSGKEEKRIKELVDLAGQHNNMYLSLCGMYWQPKDDKAIIDLHKQIDAYYHR